MTLEDIIQFLDDEQQRQTLHERTIRRCILLAYELGMEAGKAERMPAAQAVRGRDKGES